MCNPKREKGAHNRVDGLDYLCMTAYVHTDTWLLTICILKT